VSANTPNDKNLDQLPVDADTAEPIGPITLPKPGLVGSRALALLGTAGVSALALGVALGHNPTPTWR
jgi:hypothetical protein